MHVRVLTLSPDPGGGGFDDEALVSFCAEHHVTEVSHHVVVVAGVPHLVFVLTWRAQETGRGFGGSRPSSGGKRSARPAVDSLALSPAEQARYEALRQWRNQHARTTGKPPYLIFNNGQAAAIARSAPGTLAALSQVEGIGPSRVEAWGTLVLELLAGLKEDGALLAAPEEDSQGAASTPGAADG